MTVPALLEELRRRNVEVRADGDQLRCAAPVGVLTPDLRDQLRARKAEILSFLCAAGEIAHQQRAIVPLQPHGSRTPLFAIPGHNGDVFCYRALAQHLGNDQPLFGLQPPGVDGQAEPLTSVEALAAYFVSQVRAFMPNGPFGIAGYCAGGAIAFELALQLQRAGAIVDFVALFASPHPSWYGPLPQLRYRLEQQVDRVRTHARALRSESGSGRIDYIAGKLRARAARRATPPETVSDPVMAARARIEAATIAAVRGYKPGVLRGRLALLLPTREWLRPGNALLQWKSAATDTVTYCGPDGCPVDQMLREPYVGASAELVRRCVDEAGPTGRAHPAGVLLGSAAP